MQNKEKAPMVVYQVLYSWHHLEKNDLWKMQNKALHFWIHVLLYIKWKCNYWNENQMIMDHVYMVHEVTKWLSLGQRL